MEFFWSTPLALWLGLSLLIPILAHLIQRAPRNRIPFGAMMLLRRLQRIKRRHRQLSDWLLLLLRLLALAALVFAATRPELRWYEVHSNEKGPQKMILIIDNSLSMNHKMFDPLHPSLTTAFEHARFQATEQIQSVAEGSSFLIISAGGTAEQHGDWTNETTTAMGSIMDLQRGVSRTDVLGAIRIARRALEGKGGSIYVFTDEAGPSTAQGLSDELTLLSEQNASFFPVSIRAEHPQNITILSAEYSSGIEGGMVRYHVMNYGSEDREVLCTTRLPDGTEIRNFVTVSAESKAENFITVPRITEGGIASILVEDEELIEDNDFYFHLPRIGASRVLVVDGEPGATSSSSEVYFLERALAPFGGQNETLPDVINPGGFEQLKPEIHKVVFLANIMEPAPMAGILTNFVRDGGGVLISLGRNISPSRYNSALGGLMPAQIKSIQNFAQPGEEGKVMAIPDLSHDLFTPFRRGGAQEFRSVRWKTLFSVDKIDDDAKVLLSLENGAPVLLEKSVGKGRVLLLLGTIDHAWGNFPLQSIFMPFIQRSVRYLGGASSLGGKRISGQVDEELRVEIRENQSDLVLEGLKGAIGIQREGDAIRFRPRYAGAYQLKANGAPPIAQLAANHIPEESDVRVGKALIEVAAEVEPDRFIQKRSLVKWLLWMAVGAFLLQSLLSFILTKGEQDA
jgi:hypothetical protein